MNIYKYLVPKKGENFTQLLNFKNIKIIRIVSSDILEDKEYIQNKDEWVVLIKGEAILEINKKTIELKAGDTLFIPAKTPHKVLKTKKNTLWIAVHIF